MDMMPPEPGGRCTFVSAESVSAQLLSGLTLAGLLGRLGRHLGSDSLCHRSSHCPQATARSLMYVVTFSEGNTSEVITMG